VITTTTQVSNQQKTRRRVQVVVLGEQGQSINQSILFVVLLFGGVEKRREKTWSIAQEPCIIFAMESRRGELEEDLISHTWQWAGLSSSDPVCKTNEVHGPRMAPMATMATYGSAPRENCPVHTTVTIKQLQWAMGGHQTRSA
jgi:hypothetical protein